MNFKEQFEKKLAEKGVLVESDNQVQTFVSTVKKQIESGESVDEKSAAILAALVFYIRGNLKSDDDAYHSVVSDLFGDDVQEIFSKVTNTEPVTRFVSAVTNNPDSPEVRQKIEEYLKQIETYYV